MRELVFAGGALATAGCSTGSPVPENSQEAGSSDASVEDAPFPCCNANPDPCCPFLYCGVAAPPECACLADGGTYPPGATSCTVPDAGEDAGHDAEPDAPDGGPSDAGGDAHD